MRSKILRRASIDTNVQYDWGSRDTVGFKAIDKLLWHRVPYSGEVHDATGANKKLERLRRASKLCYDLFNNGLCNRRGQFMSFFRSHLPKIGRIPKYHENPSRETWDRIERGLGAAMQDITLDAFKEQYPDMYYTIFDTKSVAASVKAVMSRGEAKVLDVPEEQQVVSWR